jgi:hypothetical protein
MRGSVNFFSFVQLLYFLAPTLSFSHCIRVTGSSPTVILGLSLATLAVYDRLSTLASPPQLWCWCVHALVPLIML